MTEPQLNEESKGAIRKYMLSLIALPAVVVSLVSFAVGFGVRDWAAKSGEVEAFRLAQDQLTGFVEKVSEAKSEALQATEEARASREEALALVKDLTLERVRQNSGENRKAVAEALRKDESFLSLLRDPCRDPREICKCTADTGGDVEGYITVCISRCSDGRVTDFRVKKLELTNTNAKCPPNP